MQDISHPIPVPVLFLSCSAFLRTESYPLRAGYDHSICERGNARAYNTHKTKKSTQAAHCNIRLVWSRLHCFLHFALLYFASAAMSSSAYAARVYHDKDTQVLRISASDVAAIAGYNEWTDIRELFLERMLYQVGILRLNRMSIHTVWLCNKYISLSTPYQN